MRKVFEAYSKHDSFEWGLQRGRTRVSAEGTLSLIPVTAAVTLQRGRTRVSAEGAVSTINDGVGDKLQRGRTRVSAEGCVPSTPSFPIRPCFNGAALV